MMQPSARARASALLVFLTMLPVTGVVPILKSFVMDGFAVSEFETHLFLAFNMVSAFLFAPVVSALADRHGDARRWIVLAAVADAVLFALMPYAPSYAALMALRFVEGIAHITVLSLLLGGLAAQSETRPGAQMALVGAAITFGVALGSPLGGALGQSSPALALGTGAAIMLLVAALAWRMLGTAPAAGTRPPLKEILATLYRHPALHLPYLFAFLDRFTVGFFVASFPIYAALRFGFEPARIGLNIAAFMLTMGLLCYPTVTLARFFSQRTLILAGSVVYGALFAAIGLIGERGLPLWMILLGIASAVMFIPTLQLASRAAPTYARGTAMGGFNAAGALGFLLGPLVSGMLFTALEPGVGGASAYSIIFLIGGGLEFTIGLALLATGWLPAREAETALSTVPREP